MSRGEAQRATVRLAARAKINLRLNILAREATGYHQIETLFCALDLADDIEIAMGGDGLRFEVEGEGVPAGPDNLVHRAAQAFFAAAQLPAAALVRLRKRIPVGAGLGGGSSDAASTLRGLNLLSGNPLGDEQLVRIGSTLGSDVPFFLCGSSYALAWGRGDRLLPLKPLPARPVLLVTPAFAIATAEAYRDLAASRAHDGVTRPAVASYARLLAWDAVAEDAANDFEPTLFQRYPQLQQIKRALADAGAAPALVSGSGSTVCGIFANDRAAARAARRIRDAFTDVKTTETGTIAWTAGGA